MPQAPCPSTAPGPLAMPGLARLAGAPVRPGLLSCLLLGPSRQSASPAASSGGRTSGRLHHPVPAARGRSQQLLHAAAPACLASQLVLRTLAGRAAAAPHLRLRRAAAQPRRRASRRTGTAASPLAASSAALPAAGGVGRPRVACSSRARIKATVARALPEDDQQAGKGTTLSHNAWGTA